VEKQRNEKTPKELKKQKNGVLNEKRCKKSAF
jgi:hypothetical protein